MGYCTVNDLYQAYGEDRIAGWSRLNPDTVGRAIVDASAEIDGYLLSGGYTVPLAGTPATIKKYCIDMACASLVLSVGLDVELDPGGKAVYEQAKVGRRYLEKVAEGKFRIPGYTDLDSGEAERPQSGNIRVSSRRRLDLRGY
jgi:phage gp36-like protein